MPVPFDLYDGGMTDPNSLNHHIRRRNNIHSVVINEFPKYLFMKSDKHTVIFEDEIFSYCPSEKNET